MHKARENNDGTFSIGKTWPLEDLTAIKSFDGFVPQSQAEEQQKQWAGSLGFTITIGKNYYWQTSTAKEKDFFIRSMVKVYRRYTRGNMPAVIGFNDHEHQQGAAAAPPPPIPAARAGPPPPPAAAAAAPTSVRMPNQQDVLRDTRAKPSPSSSDRPPPRPQKNDALPRSSEDRFPRMRRSHDQMPPPPLSQPAKTAQPAMPPYPLDSKRTASPLTRPLERSPAAENHTPERPVMPMPFEAKASPGLRPRPYADLDNGSQASLRSYSSSREGKVGQETRSSPAVHRGLDRLPGPSSPDVRWGRDATAPPSASVENLSLTSDSGVTAQKKPSVDSGGTLVPHSNGNGPVYRKSGLFPPPTLRPGPSKSDENFGLTSSSYGPSDATRTMGDPGENNVSDGEPRAPKLPAVPASVPRPVNSAPMVETSQEQRREVREWIGSPEATFDEEVDGEDANEQPPEEHRPGLGPMVKKKSGKDVAGAFRKAANAYAAFRPRPGGAGERLLAAATKETDTPTTDEPDGITGVVPAPSLRAVNDLKPASDGIYSAQTASSELSQPTPAIEVTAAPVDRNVSDTVSKMGAASRPSDDLSDRRSRSRSRSPSPSPSGLRRRRRENETEKYCQSLGIDPKVLDGHGIEFDDVLTDLGWNGRLGDDRKVEDLEADIRREIGRVEATSWLGNLDQQDAKVEQLAKLIDKTIEECDELDGLLTLYSHELNVRTALFFFCHVVPSQGVC